MRYPTALSLVIVALCASGAVGAGDIYCNNQGRDCSDRPSPNATVVHINSTPSAASNDSAPPAEQPRSHRGCERRCPAEGLRHAQAVQKDVAAVRDEQCKAGPGQVPEGSRGATCLPPEQGRRARIPVRCGDGAGARQRPPRSRPDLRRSPPPPPPPHPKQPFAPHLRCLLNCTGGNGSGTTMRTGFVGLGAMGTSMARNLHRAGLLHAVWNRSAEKARSLGAELKCAAPPELRTLARECEVVVICVSADRDVLSLVAAMAPDLRDRSIVIDCSTVAADTARAAGEQLASARSRFSRCPGQRRRRGSRQGHAGDHGRRRGEASWSAPGPCCRPWAPRSRTSASRRRPGGQGHEPDHGGRDHPRRCRGDGVRGRSRPGPGQGDRHARPGRGRQLVSDPSRTEHGTWHLSARLSRAAPPEGPEHLPRDGARARRRACP